LILFFDVMRWRRTDSCHKKKVMHSTRLPYVPLTMSPMRHLLKLVRIVVAQRFGSVLLRVTPSELYLQ
jgi:hypothetical protein